jgi:hypothetical protein
MPCGTLGGLFCLGRLKRQSTLPRGSANHDSRGRLPPIPSSIANIANSSSRTGRRDNPSGSRLTSSA